MDLNYYKCTSCGSKFSPQDAHNNGYICSICSSKLEKGLGNRNAYFSNSVVYPQIDNSLCIKCAICVNVCPVVAIYMGEYPVIDHQKCTICRICVLRCPEKAIF